MVRGSSITRCGKLHVLFRCSAAAAGAANSPTSSSLAAASMHGARTHRLSVARVPTFVSSGGLAQLVGRIMIRRYVSLRWRVTPEPAIGPRFARTRWAPTRPTGRNAKVYYNSGLAYRNAPRARQTRLPEQASVRTSPFGSHRRRSPKN
jgi:hypothetical protein